MNLIEFVNSLSCEKVYPGDERVLNKLDSFQCGDNFNPRTTTLGKSVSEKMLKRFKDYLNSKPDSNVIHDLYYIVEDAKNIFIFFSLQASQVFDPGSINPGDLGKLFSLKNQSMGNDDFSKDSVDQSVFKNFLENYGLSQYGKNDEAVANTICYLSMIAKIRENVNQNSVFALQTYPCVEMVNFCKNKAADDGWHKLNVIPNMGATLFWLKIIPIIEHVCETIGCTYVSLFAADESIEKEKLISYYNQVLFFQKDEKIKAVKPQYDWECMFLCQKVRVLVEQKESFIKNYLVGTDEDNDV